MNEISKTRLFWMTTNLLVFASILTVVVSLAVGLHHWVEGLTMFAAVVSIGWIGMLTYLASK